MCGLCLILGLTACHHVQHIVPIREARSTQHSHVWHIVRKGETLYSIAWQHDSDYRSLAKYNGLRAPYALKIGQRLRLRPWKPTQRQRKVVHRTSSVHKRVLAPSKNLKTPRIKWVWPTAGKVINTFGKPRTNKGLNIVGRQGQWVRATSAGRVAYAGQGLRGYGKLLILKHNDLYLSAYAHNHELLVREGAWVKTGQVIARMGRSGTQRVMLHFEIRRTGKPVNPLHYLPKR